MNMTLNNAIEDLADLISSGIVPDRSDVLAALHTLVIAVLEYADDRTCSAHDA